VFIVNILLPTTSLTIVGCVYYLALIDMTYVIVLSSVNDSYSPDFILLKY